MKLSLSQLIAQVRRGIPARQHIQTGSVEKTAPLQQNTEGFREPTEEERTLLIWLLQHGEAEAAKLIPQVEQVTVRPSCTCGCPSIALYVPPSTDARAEPSHIVADFVGRIDGLLVGLMLRTAGGRLADLEVYDLEGMGRTFGLPDISSLEPFSPTEQ